MRIQLETQRLYLKSVDSGAASRVLEYLVRNKNFLSEWEPIRPENYFTLSEQERILDTTYSNMQKGTVLSLWILKKEDSEFIGNITFSNIIKGHFLSSFLGYKLDVNEINNGYMTEALKAAIDYVFETLKLHRIEANIMPANKQSIRVVEKLSFVNEGISRNYLKINGTWQDHIHYVLFNDNIE